jgi:hypothetical protein
MAITTPIIKFRMSCCSPSTATVVASGGQSDPVQKGMPRLCVFDGPKAHGTDDNSEQKSSHRINPVLAAATALASRSKSNSIHIADGPVPCRLARYRVIEQRLATEDDQPRIEQAAAGHCRPRAAA